jgi:hypothetical protein
MLLKIKGRRKKRPQIWHHFEVVLHLEKALPNLFGTNFEPISGANPAESRPHGARVPEQEKPAAVRRAPTVEVELDLTSRPVGEWLTHWLIPFYVARSLPEPRRS